MALTPINILVGEATIFESEPNVEYNIDCVYRPFSPGIFLSDDPTWGIYGLDGKLLSAAAYVRGPEMALIGQSAFLNIEQSSIPRVDEEHIYFGPFIGHYGHFIVTSLARAWFISKRDPKRSRLLCHSDHDVAAHFRGYMGRLADGLQLTYDQFTLPRQPTRFTRLTIPHVAFLEQKHAYTAFVEPMHKIGDSVLRGAKTDGSDKPIYLSKSRSQAGSVSSITNESEVADQLRDRGVEICFPEQLSFRDQVRLFSSRRKILGFAGSAFHNHIFSRRPPRMTCVTLDPRVNSNLILLDKLQPQRRSIISLKEISARRPPQAS